MRGLVRAEIDYVLARVHIESGVFSPDDLTRELKAYRRQVVGRGDSKRARKVVEIAAREYFEIRQNEGEERVYPIPEGLR